MGRRFAKLMCWVSLVISMVALGCAHSPDRFHSEYASHRATIRRVLILPPEIQLFTEIDAGRPILQDQHSQDVSHRAQTSLAQSLSASAMDVCFADPRTLQASETQRLRALYRNVNRAIQLHAYGPQVFTDKLRHFDYAVGSVAPWLDRMHADALMLVTGRQMVTDSRTRTWISVAVVERSGRIIWYGLRGRQTTEGQLDQRALLGISRRVIEPFLKRST